MIKDDIIHLLDNIVYKNKFSNIELNYYFNIKNYTKQEKAFIKNILNEHIIIYLFLYKNHYTSDFYPVIIMNRKWNLNEIKMNFIK